ncbi:hypothetical protein [Amycolatopsis sp. KNN50.9b]|uniref:hypothetical protein n=1 Tax=Amycolatopsis sp. KNN50.9b TaxID=2018303 RepID=UPI000B8AD5A0|nr:hypothetical protein [Amycolatopsis sp. KNN50.9b]OXM68592.1 hypothetical protein CF166_22775 [Amycolatopsis sp. KNN50.9b]
MAKKFGKRNKKPAQLGDLFGAPPPPPRSGPPASSTPLSDYLSQGLPGVDDGYVVLPRSLAEGMSLPWQQQMAALLSQFHQTHRSLSWPIYRTVPSRYEKLVDLDEEQLAEVGYLVEIDADGDMVYRERSGRKVEEPENTTVLVPCLDPIPPRGRTSREAEAPAPAADAPRAAPMIIPPAPVWRTTPTTPSPEVPPLPEPPKKLAAPRTPPESGPALPSAPEAGAVAGPAAVPGAAESGSGVARVPGAPEVGPVAGAPGAGPATVPGAAPAGPVTPGPSGSGSSAAPGASPAGPVAPGAPQAGSATGASQAGPGMPATGSGPAVAPAGPAAPGPSGAAPNAPSPEGAQRVTNPQAWRTMEPPEEPPRFTEPLPPQPQPTPAAGIPLGGLTKHDPEPTPPQGTPRVNRDWFEPDQPEHEFGPTGQPTELPYRYRP